MARHASRGGGTLGIGDGAPGGAFRHVSFNHLACLLRHWLWAEDARTRFEGARGQGWEQDVDPGADRLYGAFYQWCALLCGVAESAGRGDISNEPGGEVSSHDLDTSLPVLQAGRDVLAVVPTTREGHPRIIDLLREGETLQRLRRVHRGCGEALRREQDARERDMLDLHQP
jgi:hypothetical protein